MREVGSQERRRIRVVSPRMCGLTDVGLVRPTNEDDLHVTPDGVLIVADGLGGLPAGEVASAIAVEAAAGMLAQRAAGTLDVADAASLLRSAFAAANRAVGERADRDRYCHGMATTLIAALVAETALTVAHVGDVRAYRVTDGGLERLTDDHTRAWESVVSGEISEEAARHSPYRNALTRVLGFGPVEPSVRSVALAAHDVVLLCSDGLWDPVGPHEIEVILRNRSLDAEQRACALADAALAAGGPDNITAIVYQHA